MTATKSYRKKKKPPIATIGSSLSRGVGRGVARTAAAKPPPAPARTARPQAPVQTAAPYTPKPNLAASLSSLNNRTDAREKYALGLADVNRGLLEAAMDYGGAPNVLQYGLDDSTILQSPVAANSNSRLAQLGRWVEEAKQVEADNNLRSNTFFSGLHQKAQKEVDDEGSRQRTQAELDYRRALADYDAAIQELRQGRDSAFRNADIADLEAQQAAALQAGPIPPEAQAPAAPAAPLNASQQMAQKLASLGNPETKWNSKGLWYRRKADGKWIRLNF